MAELTRQLLDKFPSSAAFDAINDSLQSSEADRKDAIKQGNAVFGFTLKNAAGETESWHIDLKEKGEVNKGLPAKPTGEFYNLNERSPATLAGIASIPGSKNEEGQVATD
jgi:hypothetical protein